MDKRNFKSTTTQEGPRERESLHAPACSPQSYSGGDKNCSFSNDDLRKRTTDSGKSNEVVLGGASLREARVVLSRYEESGQFSSPAEDSDNQSLVSVESLRSRASLVHSGRKRGRGAGVDGDSITSDSEVEEPAAKLVTPQRRGRGRPPTTGEFAGLAAAKAALVAAEREEMELRAEREVAELAQRCRPTRSTPSRVSESSTGRGEEMTDDLAMRAMDCVATIVAVAAKSSNLKGTFVRSLKDAATSLREIIGDFRERSTNEETRKLMVANRRLQSEVADLRTQISELRKEMMEERMASTSAVRSSPGKSSSQAGSAPEELEQRLVRQVGEMMNARLAALEERLLPEKRVRPPLAANRKVKTQTRPTECADPGPSAPSYPVEESAVPAGSAASAVGRFSHKRTPTEIAERRRKILGLPPGAPLPPAMDPWLNPPEGMVMETNEPSPQSAPKAKGKGKGKSTKTPKLVAPSVGKDTGPSQSKPAAEGWTEVGKGSKKVSKKTAATAASKKPKAAPKPRVRIPRSSVVIMTIQPGAAERGVSYAEALTEAKRQIVPEELGIQSLTFRRAATGGRVFELAGEGNAAKADTLANRLRAIFKPEDIRVNRPEKCAELRLSGLDDSVSKVEVAEVIQRLGGCGPDSIRVKDIRRNAAGIGTTFVQCPAAAARKLAQSERIKVGWVSVRVKLLAPRPLRCYRCLEIGHVREQCKGEVDRGSQCYRCGQPGHKAGDCSAEPHCTLCAAAKKPAGHRIGGKACVLPPPKKMTATKVATIGGSGRRVRGDPPLN